MNDEAFLGECRVIDMEKLLHLPSPGKNKSIAYQYIPGGTMDWWHHIQRKFLTGPHGGFIFLHSLPRVNKLWKRETPYAAQ